MSRFVLIGAQDCIVANAPRRRLRAGQTVADTVGNAQPGDFVSAQLCASPNTRMIALDAAAVSAFAAVGITAAIGQQLGPPAGSVDSVDA
jgi:hypothetical protein